MVSRTNSLLLPLSQFVDEFLKALQVHNHPSCLETVDFVINLCDTPADINSLILVTFESLCTNIL